MHVCVCVCVCIGEEAVKAKNTFYYLTYTGSVILDDTSDPNLRKVHFQFQFFYILVIFVCMCVCVCVCVRVCVCVTGSRGSDPPFWPDAISAPD